ncbi:hypothetical protein PVAP13_9NG538314 [Panicum virgatum]|uniref:Uncharacterized protein n=1 Tax=Panicum virgatum TaxID=38727 RepID=A0A8T0MVX8_PANVG|nr:hypothetical protein PVAP13_9NG538314 [Panicum virgatum]
MVSGGFGGGVPHQDYPLPLARPPGIILSRVNRARPRPCSQQNITTPSIRIRIDYFKWHTEVLQCLGDTPLQVETTEHLQFKKMTISFEIPLRQDPGTMMAIVASGKESPIQMTYERTAIKACLLELESYGYLIPNLS